MKTSVLTFLIVSVINVQNAASRPQFTDEQIEQMSLQQQPFLDEIESPRRGFFARIRNMFGFGGNRQTEGDIEEQLAPSSFPSYGKAPGDSTKEPGEPYRPGNVRLTRRRVVTRVILRRRNPPLRRNQIERDLEDDTKIVARDHRRLDKELRNERRYYRRNKDPRDPNTARQAVPDPRRERQYGFKPSKLFKRPMPQLDFTSKQIGFQGDYVFPTGLTAY